MPRRHHVTVRETESAFIVDGGIHIPKARPFAKQEVEDYKDRWDVDRYNEQKKFDEAMEKNRKWQEEKAKAEDATYFEQHGFHKKDAPK